MIWMHKETGELVLGMFKAHKRSLCFEVRTSDAGCLKLLKAEQYKDFVWVGWL